MALSKASCTGRGLIPAIGGHVHRMFDEGEDDLFSLSLDDVMDDRPWTADELMGGGVRPSSPNSALAPKPASAPAHVCAGQHRCVVDAVTHKGITDA